MEYMATGYQDKKIRVDRALESFGTSEVLSEGWCVQYVCDEAGKSSGLESGGFGQVRRGWAGYGVLQYQVTYGGARGKYCHQASVPRFFKILRQRPNKFPLPSNSLDFL